MLCRESPYQEQQYSKHKKNALYLWTFPYKVIELVNSRNAAQIQSLLDSRNVQTVYIINVIFVNAPQSELQQEKWAVLAAEELELLKMKSEKHNIKLQTFVQQITQPVKERHNIEGKLNRKRQRWSSAQW